MKKIFLFTILFLFFLTISLDLAAKQDSFKTSYICYDLKGNKRWVATTQIVPCQDKGKDIYLMIERGEGYYSGFKDKIGWLARLEFESNKDFVRPLKMQKDIFSESKERLAVEIQEFDFINKKVKVSYEDLVLNKKVNKELKFKGDIANRLILGLYIQKFLENGQKKARVYLLSNQGDLYKVNIKVLGKEEITINGDKKMAYKMSLDPDIGLLNILKVLLPKAYVWHRASPNFEWLKYLGLESKVNSPKVEIKTLD